MGIESVTTREGYGVMHLYYHVHRAMLSGAQGAAKDFATRLDAFDDREGYQVIAFSVLGQKADFGIMALGPDLAALDGLAVELAGSPLGQVLSPAASYVSLTEVSPYTRTEEDEAARLAEEEGLPPGDERHEEQLAAFRKRQAEYREKRLYPTLPRKRLLSFYPLSKRRETEQNWYALPFTERKRLMGGHAAVGRSYAGRVVQLITGSVGLDDWEWGVTLLADDPSDIKDVVTDMRYDEVSARYTDFGPFVTGLVGAPQDVMAHLHLA